MTRRFQGVLTVICALLLSRLAIASAPSLMNYQGVLKDGSGTPQVGGPFNVTFSIYDDASATNLAVWAETRSVTTDAEGRFSVLLGSLTSLTDTTFSGNNRWLGTKVSPDVSDLLPRTHIVTVAYAFRPATVDGATGGNITSKVAIGPGQNNSGAQAFVAGQNNSATGDYSTVSRGEMNTSSGLHSTIGGGILNQATENDAAVAGGHENSATANSATVGGGADCHATGLSSTVGGGAFNSAGNENATVAGGFSNSASGISTTVGGGYDNTASGGTATVSGGSTNSAAGDYASVGGGYVNSAGGYYATTPGGFGNSASGRFSFAAGRGAQANHSGTFVWNDSSVVAFTSTGPNQFLIRAGGGVGIGTAAPSEQLDVAGNIRASGCLIGSNLACPSDVRYKKNIVTIDHALDAVESLRGVGYEWKREDFPDRDFDPRHQIGLIAQEVRLIVPSAVQEMNDGYLAVDYSRLVPLLIEGMKEQQKRIEALEKKLERQAP